MERLKVSGRFDGREVRLKDFVVPVVRMAKYVSLRLGSVFVHRTLLIWMHGS